MVICVQVTKRDPHPAKDLTVDHYKAKVLGGNPLGPFIILCRSCNSRKGNHEQQLKMATAHSKLTKVPTTATDKDFFTGYGVTNLTAITVYQPILTPVLFLQPSFRSVFFHSFLIFRISKYC